MPLRDILGHEQILQELRTAWSRGRVPHAYLFSGLDGIGKVPTAIAFFQLLSCKSPVDGPDACGKCRQCRLVADGHRPDFVRVEREGRFIKIDQIREINRAVRFPPVDSSTRTILIPDADTMNEPGANSLPKTPEEPNAQFEGIAALRDRFLSEALPIISIDTKKKEIVGRFKNAGAAWNREPVLVNDHDFRSDALGIAIPYGIYDLQANRGTVFVGTSCDTPQFAVECIERWWRTEGQQRYPETQHLAILADGGGSNAASSRAWKHGLQTCLCNRHRLTVTVAHYTPGASKWKPIEHRLFIEISKKWAGHPLARYQTNHNHIRPSTTSTGLRVSAHLVRRKYRKGLKITDAQMRALSLSKSETLPKWNYTLCPL